jgi:uncharacterized membrane protein HdeD (DUF308 family)
MLLAGMLELENDYLVADDSWLAVAGPTVLLLSIATLAAVLLMRRSWAVSAFAAHAVVGGAAAWFALVELSTASDALIVVCAFSIAASGIAALWLTFAGRPSTAASWPHEVD